MQNNKEIVIFETEDKQVKLPVAVDNETVWLNRNQMSDLFGRDVKTVGKHINNALKEELEEQVVVAKFATTTQHGAIEGKTQTHMTEYYNLDVIISVGYRVKSKRGVEFRRWANSVLKQYILKGYALNDIVMTRSQMIESYMVFGGIPHYLNLLDSRLSLAQNVNELCFKEYGYLHDEYHNLFYSLYDKPEKHIAILETLASNRDGLTRAELSKEKEIGGGSVLTKDLRELEECGFIRKFTNFTKGEGESFYQLTDPFTLFSIRFIKKKSLIHGMSILTRRVIIHGGEILLKLYA